MSTRYYRDAQRQVVQIDEPGDKAVFDIPPGWTLLPDDEGRRLLAAQDKAGADALDAHYRDAVARRSGRHERRRAMIAILAEKTDLDPDELAEALGVPKTPPSVDASRPRRAL